MLRKKKPAFNTIGQPFGKSGSPKAGGDFIFSVVKGALEEVHPGFTDPYDPEAVSQDLTAFLLKKVDGRDRHLLETWQSVADVRWETGPREEDRELTRVPLDELEPFVWPGEGSAA